MDPEDYLAPRPRKKDQTLVDRVRLDIRKDAVESTAISLLNAPPPDTVADAARLAQRFGINAMQVAGNLEEFKRRQRIEDLTSTALSISGFGSWAQNPQNAAIAADDTENVGVLGSIWQGIKNVGSSAKAGTLNTIAGLGNLTAGALEDQVAQTRANWANPNSAINQLGLAGADRAISGPVVDMLDDIAKWHRREAGAYSVSADAARPQVSNWFARNLLAGVESIPGTAASIAVGVGTRSPAAATSLMALPVAGNAYRDARDKGLNPDRAMDYAITQGGIEYLTEKLPASRLLGDIAAKSPLGKKLIGQLIEEIPGEQAATFLQDLSEWTTLHPEKTLGDFMRERPERAAETLVATVAGVAGTVGAVSTVERSAGAGKKLAAKVRRGEQAQEEGELLDAAADAATTSKIRERDPAAFKSMLDAMAEDSPNDRIFIPGSDVVAYMQSDGYDGSFDQWSEQAVEAAAIGGDVVIPIPEALATLAGTEGWKVTRPSMRLSPGGESQNEAQSFDEALADLVAEYSEDAVAPPTGRDALFQSITDKLMDAGYTPSIARTQAELLTQRYATRQERRGRHVAGDEFAGVTVSQILPEKVALAQKATGLDRVIDAMKRGIKGEGSGPSLLEFIAKRGGVDDPGGDLTSMGADSWHRGKPGTRKLLQSVDKRQNNMLAPGAPRDTSHELVLRAAIDAGYFPDLVSTQDKIDNRVLLDAIGEELSGKKRFAKSPDTTLVDGAAELERLLRDRGVDPSKATRKEIGAAVDAYVAEQGGGRAYGQDEKDSKGKAEPRGRIIFPESGFDGFSAAIELFQSRDLSTFLHETGHLWVEELRHDAADPDAVDSVREDWDAVQRWFAQNGQPIVDGVIPVEAHEMWARGVERYLMEGKSPVAGLARIFETFKTWLTNIYRSAQRLNTPVTDEIRGVMDRLLATDDELQAAGQHQSIDMMFDDADAAGMTKEEFSALQDLAGAARRHANDALLAKVMAPIRARVTKEHKARAAVVREEVAADIDSRAVFRAIKALRETPMDSDWVRERMGDDVISRLPPNVPPLVKVGGADPSDLAEMAGFGTPQDMIDALLGVEVSRKEMREKGDSRSVRAALIQQEVERIMNERYGDPFTDGSIEDEALAAVHNDVAGEVMAAELRVLGRSTGRTATPYRVAREWARNRVRSGIVNDVASLSAIQRYQRAAAKAGKAAMDAAIAGDRDAAFRAKQQQMINNALVSEAKAAQDDIETALNRLGKVAKRRSSPSIDQDYLERAQGLLEQVDLRPRSQVNIQRQAQFEEWARAQESEGVDVAVPPSFAASIGTTHWSNLSVDEFLGLDAAVKQIIHLGRLKQTLLDGQEQRAFDELVGEAQDAMGGMPQKPPSDLFEPSWWDNVKSGIASADVALLKIETLVDWLDQGNSNGTFNRIVFKPIADAQDRENDMRADYHARLGEILGRLSKEDLRRWSEPISTPQLRNRETGNAWKGDRSHLVAMALNVGNEGNRQRLVDGYGWSEAGVMDVLTRELTEADWKFVQDVWDMVDTLWPETAAMERRVNGVAPDKVEAIPVETPYGILRGGYYPAIYDSAKDYNAERNEQRAEDLFTAKYTRANTAASSTKDRVERVERPILLSLGVINRHIGEVIHDITHREAVMQAHKFLSDPRIKRGIDQTLGREYRQAFTPWLKHVANQWASERAGNEGIGKFMSGLRSNTTVVGMGWRFSTVIMQAAGYSNSLEFIGAEWGAKGAALFASSPIETFDTVMAKSGEMRHRMDTLDRDIRSTIAKMAGRNNPLTAAKRFAFHGIGYMDRVVTVPTWIGAYNRALHEGKTDEQAVYYADKAIRSTQGSASAKDLAAVATGQGQWGGFFKLSTMFYSYVSTVYQRQRTLARDARGAGVKDIPQLMARAWWLMVVPPLLSELLAGRGPDDDEDWGSWAFSNMLFQLVGAIPVVRDAAHPLYDKIAGNRSFDYQLSPIQRSVQTVINAAGMVPDIVTGEDTTNATRTMLEATGYLTGMVPGQFAQSVQFLVDVGYGEQDPQTFGDWFEGLTKGKVE
ncbi:acetyltransferase [Sphingopyxis lindanitolerans]|uniref:Acetyltransferase n=1 Tax=Sphingopyxis lindanitolerans TaxID=2054227 RepID=A0A2S8BAM0_9SPHN|nr:acetyltransferase [Sphingopyxis lindanitolerans]PQM29398.1 acetyltransferase [Sphingopyxis lindanitolerans]